MLTARDVQGNIISIPEDIPKERLMNGKHINIIVLAVKQS